MASNPFDEESGRAGSEGKRPAKGKSVTQSSPNNWDDPPKYEPPSSTSQRSAKEEELAKREAALMEREQNIAKVEGGVHPNNFPPLPPCCPIKPCCYVSLTEQIPPSEQWKMKLLTAMMIYYWVVLIYNFICTVAGLVVSTDTATYGTTMGVCIAYLLLFLPCSLFCWWYPAYYAYKNNSSLGYLWFFLVMSVQTIGFAINALGLPNLGAAGFINSVIVFNASKAVGAMFIICGLLWIVPIPFSAILIFLVHRYYRSSGKSINEATQEAMTGAASNKYVRQAAVGAAKEGIKASVTGATS